MLSGFLSFSGFGGGRIRGGGSFMRGGVAGF